MPRHAVPCCAMQRHACHAVPCWGVSTGDARYPTNLPACPLPDFPPVSHHPPWQLALVGRAIKDNEAQCATPFFTSPHVSCVCVKCGTLMGRWDLLPR